MRIQSCICNSLFRVTHILKHVHNKFHLPLLVPRISIILPSFRPFPSVKGCWSPVCPPPPWQGRHHSHWYLFLFPGRQEKPGGPTWTDPFIISEPDLMVNSSWLIISKHDFLSLSSRHLFREEALRSHYPRDRVCFPVTHKESELENR